MSDDADKAATPDPADAKPQGGGAPPRSETNERRRASGAGRVSSGLAVIFAFVALLVSGYLWYVLIYQHPALIRLDLPDTLASLRHHDDKIDQDLNNTKDQIAALTETQNTLKSAVDRVHAELGRNRTQWAVSDTEQLLLIANRRLQLARDASSALAALRAADRQLESLANPDLLPVRREIAKEITALESLDRTDIAGMSLRLGSIADSVDSLPLATDMRAPPAQAAAAQTADAGSDNSARGIWHDLLGLVRIRHENTTPRPLLPPDQQYFARENLRLMLYGAQRALLQGDVATYRQNLDTASHWLNDYFDTAAPAVDALRGEIEKLRATPLMNQLPDITASYHLLRKITDEQNQS